MRFINTVSVPGDTSINGSQATAAVARAQRSAAAAIPPQNSLAQLAAASGSIRFSHKSNSSTSTTAPAIATTSVFAFFNFGISFAFLLVVRCCCCKAATALSVCRGRAGALRSEHARRPTLRPRRPHTVLLLLLLSRCAGIEMIHELSCSHCLMMIPACIAHEREYGE